MAPRVVPPWLLMTCALGVLLALAGCGRPVARDELVYAWRVIDAEATRPRENRFGAEPASRDFASAGSFFRLYPDGRATAVLGGTFRAGRWDFDEQQQAIALNLPGTAVRRLAVRRGREHPMEFTDVSGATAGTRYFVAVDTFEYGERDIYGEELNAWRVPARGRLTDDEIRERLRTMLRFLVTYFEAAYIRGVPSLEVSDLPTPFEIASNGVALPRDSRELPERWIRLFATREEAVQAARMLSPLFRDVVVPASSNPFDRIASIFRQMELALSRQSE